MLDKSEVQKLKNLIGDSFRIRPNHDPIYVDVSDHLTRLKSRQHQIIFGRRGTGKSCLLVHFKKKEAPKLNSLTIYVDTDEIKRLGYPDVLIRLLLSVMESTPTAKQNWRKFLFCKSKIQKHIENLRVLLSQAEHKKVKEEDKKSTGVDAGGQYGGANAKFSKSTSLGKLSEFEENKLDTLERHLSDYKTALIEELQKSNYETGYVILDDYYLIKKERQPDVIDYMHRLLRGTDYYLKVGTVRHRTNLIRNEEQTIGVELRQDIEELNLDRTLENLPTASNYLASILNSMGKKVHLQDASTVIFNSQAFEKLVIASGGVPRDFLTIFVDAIDVAVAGGRTNYLTPTDIWKSASSLSYRTKLKNLRDDVFKDADAIENVFRDLMRFCIQEKKKTCFLISQEDAQKHPHIHEIVLQLMDFKLIHVVEPDTSAASGRQGRYEAYTLDFSLFMEPRKRNIDIVEFWNYDESGRRIGVREAPTYELERAGNAMNAKDNQKTEDLIDKVEGDTKM
jgi:hypothetical protein